MRQIDLVELGFRRNHATCVVGGVDELVVDPDRRVRRWVVEQLAVVRILAGQVLDVLGTRLAVLSGRGYLLAVLCRCVLADRPAGGILLTGADVGEVELELDFGRRLGATLSVAFVRWRGLLVREQLRLVSGSPRGPVADRFDRPLGGGGAALSARSAACSQALAAASRY
jgi:hypothetical protein